ncbi:MAG TPA: fumarylacetoacetate hydrolase family protein [Gemmatimonadaceae bacterium]|nr:fumarylacetoacetate hydrolase family protein [Gemmatimonadaceae bacterium]
MRLTPSKIVCVGRNYVEHAAETGSEVPSAPLLFLKPPTAVIASGEAIVMPRASSRVDHEGEIGVVIGAPLYRVTAAQARAGIKGIVAANDVTARDLQKKDGQWTRAKGFDTFCPVGPMGQAPADLSSMEIFTRVNGEVRQHARATEMVFSIPDILAYASQVMTLLPGDLVLTGTPSGISPLAEGDVVEVEIVGVSTVSSPVVAERA